MSSLGVTYQDYSSKMLGKIRNNSDDTECIRIPNFLNDYGDEQCLPKKKETKDEEVLDIAIQKIYNDISTKSYDSNYYELVEEEKRITK